MVLLLVPWNHRQTSLATASSSSCFLDPIASAEPRHLFTDFRFLLSSSQ